MKEVCSACTEAQFLLLINQIEQAKLKVIKVVDLHFKKCCACLPTKIKIILLNTTGRLASHSEVLQLPSAYRGTEWVPAESNF